MDKKHIIQRQGKDFVLFEGLLSEAHEQGLCRISTVLIQVPHPDNGNVAIVHAEVEVTKGTFSGIGDASATNVGQNIKPHIIRMAETRAKARALRDAVNIGMVAAEELADHTTDDGRSVDTRTGEVRDHPASGPVANPPANGSKPPTEAEKRAGSKPATASEKKAAKNMINAAAEALNTEGTEVLTRALQELGINAGGKGWDGLSTTDCMRLTTWGRKAKETAAA